MKIILRKFWVLKNKEAVPLNYKEIETFTGNLIHRINSIALAKEISKIEIKNNLNLIFKANKQIIKKIDKKILIDFVKELQRYSILNYYKINERDIINFYCCVIDLFKKLAFLKALKKQIKSERHLHGLSKGILKHLWSVSLFCYIKSKKERYALSITRAGFLHDITLKHNNFVADLVHQKSAASLARKIGETEDVVSAIEDHLFFDILRLRRFPKTTIARKLLLYDTIISSQERITSILLKIKNL